MWPNPTLDMARMPGMGPTMGVGAPVFLAIWIVMMIAMMFPTAAPIILVFHSVQAGKRARGEAFVATWIFVAAYLFVWSAIGIVAFVAASAAESIATARGLTAA